MGFGTDPFSFQLAHDPNVDRAQPETYRTSDASEASTSVASCGDAPLLNWDEHHVDAFLDGCSLVEADIILNGGASNNDIQVEFEFPSGDVSNLTQRIVQSQKRCSTDVRSLECEILHLKSEMQQIELHASQRLAAQEDEMQQLRREIAASREREQDARIRDEISINLQAAQDAKIESLLRTLQSVEDLIHHAADAGSRQQSLLRIFRASLCEKI